MAEFQQLHAILVFDGCTAPILPTQSTPWRQWSYGDGHGWAGLSPVRWRSAAR